jgi:hypothetical protein
VESFFQNGSSLDLIEVEELLLFYYHDINYILNLNLEEGIFFINKAWEKNEERKAWDMWIARYVWMDKDNFIPFSEFYSIQTTPTINKSKNEILSMADEIEKKAQKERGDIENGS